MNHSSRATHLPSAKPVHGDNNEPSHEILELINYNIFTFVDPMAVALGAVGNLVVCLVFTLTPLKVRPWSHVQSAICGVDMMYVMSCFAVYLSKRGEPVYDMPGLCQMTTLSLMVSRSLQTWFVFISHFDRLNSHFNHSRERRKRRVYNTKFALLIVTLLVVAPSVHVLWSYEVRTMYGRSYCVPMRDDMHFHIIMRKIHIIGCIIVPIALTVGIDLFFVLKLALHCLCTVNDEDDDDDVGNLGVYTGYKIGNDSSFCSESIVQLPLQEKKSDMREHLLSNIETCRQKPKNNLSTIVENSVTSSGNQNKQISHHVTRLSSMKVDNENGEKDGDKFSILQKKYKCDRKQEVARYILTTGTNEDCVSEKEKIPDLKLNFDNNELQKNKPFDKLSRSPIKLSPDFGSGRDHNRNKSENNNKRSPRSYGKPNKKRRSGANGGNAKDGSQVSVYSSSMNHSCTHNSVSYSHYHSYNYTSMVSNVSKSTVIPKDHMLANDMTSSSVTAVIIGIAMCGLVIPSAYVEGKILFFSSVPTTRPSAFSVQRSILFESLVLFNSVYKILLYVVVMKSFRQAFVWLVITCVPRRFTSSSSICTIEFDDDNKSDSDNIDDV